MFGMSALRWRRAAAREGGEILSPYPQTLAVTALGGSVPTEQGGLRAEVALFETLKDLQSAPAGSLSGRIAYVGHAMQRTQDGSSYGYFNKARTAGPSIAASKGAVGYLIRSVGTDSHRFLIQDHFATRRTYPRYRRWRCQIRMLTRLNALLQKERCLRCGSGWTAR